MAIEILSKTFIKPSSPTPPQHQTYNLSFFDLLAPQFHVPWIFFYSSDPTSLNSCGPDPSLCPMHTGCSSSTRLTISDPTTIPTNYNRLEHLKMWLSETLTLYPPLSGRFKEDGLSVSCHDQGVLYLEAQAQVQLAHFLTHARNDTSLVEPLFPQDIGESKGVDTPMVAIQCTTFECGGIALAISFTHSLLDGYLGATFIDKWATMNQQGKNLSDHQIIVPHIADHFQVDILGESPPPAALTTGAKIITKTFVFNKEAILNLKAKYLITDSNNQPSRVAILAGYIWRTFIRISKAKHGRMRPSILTLSFNLRGRTSIGQISSSSFGNVYFHIPIRFDLDKFSSQEADSDNLHDHLVGLIRDTVKRAILSFSKASTQGDVAKLAMEFQNEIREGMKSEEVDVHRFTSWCNFPLSRTDFGWGKPAWIGSTLPAEIVALMDTRCGNGIEARVNLNERDMREFERDSAIRPFVLIAK